VALEDLAINGGQKVRDKPYPSWPVLGEEDVAAVAKVLRSGKLTQLTGDAVSAFEESFADRHGVRNCVATSSGTTAMHAVLAALEIGPGDEVIVPAHTFIASATPVLHQRATPVFADVDRRTFCISPESVAQRITARTRAIIAVHLNGHPADMDALMELARTREIAVIEDAAQAHGAMHKGRRVGTIGRAACFSFWEDKIITTGGEGGCALTDDDALAERMQRIRHHGEGAVEGERAYYHLELGYNYRMSSMHAATGLVQLRRLEDYLDARRRNAAFLTERLTRMEPIDPPFVAADCVHSYYKYICRLRPEAGIDIEDFVRAVAAEGVPISRRYPTPLPRQPVFRDGGFGDQRCPVAERLGGELFTLLVHPTVTEGDMDDVVGAVRKVTDGLAVSRDIGEGPREAIASILESGFGSVWANERDVQERLVEPCLTALGWPLDSTNTEVWVPLSEPMAKLWNYSTSGGRMRRDYALSAEGKQVIHMEAKLRWGRYAVDLDTFLGRINEDDWEDTRRDGPNKDLALLLWGARAAGVRRAALIDEQRLLIFDWDGDWRLAREVDLFVDPFERVYSAFALLSPP